MFSGANQSKRGNTLRSVVLTHGHGSEFPNAHAHDGPWAMGLSGFVRWLLEALGSLERLRAMGRVTSYNFCVGMGMGRPDAEL